MENILQSLQTLTENGRSQNHYSAAQLVIAEKNHTLFQTAVGTTKSSQSPHSPVPTANIQHDSLFDIASLTKPLATSALMMIAVDEHRISLSQKLISINGIHVPSWMLEYTVADLLSHHTPLKPLLDLHGPTPRIEDHRSARNYAERQILESSPRDDDASWCYSDLGFILLGFILETLYNTQLEKLFRDKIASPLQLDTQMMFCPLHHVDQRTIVATSLCCNTPLQGHPDDANARALTHQAGHAGLFASAQAIATFVQSLFDGRFPCSKNTIQTFLSYHHAQTPFALGWDRPTSSLSLSARTPGDPVLGHLGYTGCSLWIDLDSQRSVTFLTNRTHCNNDPHSIAELRRQIMRLSWSI